MDFEELMKCYYISGEENNQYSYDHLLESMKKQNIYPVIGAGLSCWVYPLWDRLLKEIGRDYGLEMEIDELLKRNQYEKAASLLESEMYPNRWRGRLEYEFRDELLEEAKDKCPDYLKMVPYLFSGPVITTNFDRVIEYLFQLNRKDIPDRVVPEDCYDSYKTREAIHASKPVIVKLHGDIKNVAQLVLTEKKYDEVYGPDPDNPDMNLLMPKFLKSIFERNPLLFLGCSLKADRTCSVMQKCLEGCEQFAFLELPPATENKSDWKNPVLRKENRKLLDELQERREYLDKLQIKPVWYPYGRHKEAYEAFFTRLCEDLHIRTSEEKFDDVKYYSLHNLAGRDHLVQEIASALTDQTYLCVWVYGSPGIGKTEICKAVYRNLKKKYGELCMPFIDVAGADGLPAFFAAAARSMNIKISSRIKMEEVPEYLLEEMEQKYPETNARKAPRLLYIDNWEDIWYALDEKHKEDLLQWIRRLCLKKFHILVSSVEKPLPALNSCNFVVDVLDRGKLENQYFTDSQLEALDSVKVFYGVWGRSIVPAERTAFIQLIRELEGHPLAIVLAAAQARQTDDIRELLVQWSRAKQDTTGIRKTHASLETSVEMVWNKVRKSPGAVIQWGLEFFSISAIPKRVFNELRGDDGFLKDQWEEGLAALYKANLVYYTKDDDGIAMLMPLKRQFPYLDKNGPIYEYCLKLWAETIIDMAYMANQLKMKERQYFHETVLEMTPQIFHIMNHIMNSSTEILHPLLNHMVIVMQTYFQYSLQAEDVLKRLIDYYERKEQKMLPCLLRMYGDILRKTGRLDEAAAVNKRVLEMLDI